MRVEDGFADARTVEGYRERRRQLLEETKNADARMRNIYANVLETVDNVIRSAAKKRKLEVHVVPLDRGIPDDPEMRAMVESLSR